MHIERNYVWYMEVIILFWVSKKSSQTHKKTILVYTKKTILVYTKKTILVYTVQCKTKYSTIQTILVYTVQCKTKYSTIQAHDWNNQGQTLKNTREHNTDISHDQRIFFLSTHHATDTLIKKMCMCHNIKISIKIKWNRPHNANTHKLVTRNDIS